VIAFSAACGTIVVSLLIFLVRPLRVPRRGVDMATPVDANVAVYRQQLAELEADLGAGLVADDQFFIERDALEERVIADLAQGSHAIGKARPIVRPGRLTYWLIIGVPLAAALIYAAIGAPHAILQSP
jgi:cytochrome c-type biogenesis protein CcmH